MNVLQKYYGIFLFVLFAVFTSLMFSVDQVHAQACGVEVIKNAEPADNTPFNFTAVVLGTPEPFVLTDPDNNVVSIALGLNSTIAEEVPPGWELASIECEAREGDEDLIDFIITGSTVTINCVDGTFGFGTCVFNNVLESQNVPTLSQWGLIAMAGILGIVGFMVARRKKVSA